MSRRAMHSNAASQQQAAMPRLATDKNALHRCGIALCSHPAVSQGVCSMHLSRSSSSPASMNGGYASPAASLNGDSGRFYRSSAHSAMQPRTTGGGPANKKQKTAAVSTDRSGRMAAAPPSSAIAASALPYDSYNSYNTNNNGSSMALTQDSLNQMNHNHARLSGLAPWSASYDSSSSAAAFLSHSHPHHSASSLRPSGSTNDGDHSVHSDSEHSVDAATETSQRRERNRIAARKSRQRKLDRISNLEDEKMRLEQHRDMLVQEIRSLEKRDAAGSSNATSDPASAFAVLPDHEYARLQDVRVQIIKAVEDAYNSGDICATLQYFRDDSIVSGPQNSSVHLRGKDALVLDYLCTTYLFRDIHLRHAKIDSGGPRSQHFRVHWTFSGCVKSAGVSMNKEFLELIDSVQGKRVTIEGVSNFSFSADKIVYVHRTADQAKFLSALVQLSKQQ